MGNLVEDSIACQLKEKSNVIILSVAQNHALISSFLLLFRGDFFVFLDISRQLTLPVFARFGR